MSRRVLLDQGLPRSAAQLLRERGWEAGHVGERGLSRASDREILALAASEDRVCVILDADFHALVALGQTPGPSVVWIRVEGLNGPALVRLLEDVWLRVEQRLAVGALVTINERAVRVRALPITR